MGNPHRLNGELLGRGLEKGECLRQCHSLGLVSFKAGSLS